MRSTGGLQSNLSKSGKKSMNSDIEHLSRTELSHTKQMQNTQFAFTSKGTILRKSSVQININQQPLSNEQLKFPKKKILITSGERKVSISPITPSNPQNSKYILYQTDSKINSLTPFTPSSPFKLKRSIVEREFKSKRPQCRNAE